MGSCDEADHAGRIVWWGGGVGSDGGGRSWSSGEFLVVVSEFVGVLAVVSWMFGGVVLASQGCGRPNRRVFEILFA